MRTTLTLAILSFTTTTALSQQVKPVRSDTRKLLELIPKGCASTAEARAKCADSKSEALAPFKQALEAIQKERIAGKGHETSQTIGDTVTPFDDREAARIALADLGGWTL